MTQSGGTSVGIGVRGGLLGSQTRGSSVVKLGWKVVLQPTSESGKGKEDPMAPLTRYIER